MTFTDQSNGVTAMAGAAEVIEFQTATLPILIDRASRALLDAKTSAEVLEARDMAQVAYDAAKSSGRLERAQRAHDEVHAAVNRSQGEALLVLSRAKMRLADEIDAAQSRGELATGRDGPGAGVLNGNAKGTAAEINISRKDTHEARKLRDAEKASPGKAERVIKEIVARGEEPTKAKLRREMVAPAASVKEPSAPIDPERRKLAKLTQDALIDEVLGLRADLADAKSEAAKLKAERDALKVQVSELRASDSTSVISQLQIKLKNAENAKWREGEKTTAAMRQVHALKKELKRLGAVEIPL